MYAPRVILVAAIDPPQLTPEDARKLKEAEAKASDQR
jgi:hypothetical protein